MSLVRRRLGVAHSTLIFDLAEREKTRLRTVVLLLFGVSRASLTVVVVVVMVIVPAMGSFVSFGACIWCVSNTCMYIFRYRLVR